MSGEEDPALLAVHVELEQPTEPLVIELRRTLAASDAHVEIERKGAGRNEKDTGLAIGLVVTIAPAAGMPIAAAQLSRLITQVQVWLAVRHEADRATITTAHGGVTLQPDTPHTLDLTDAATTILLGKRTIQTTTATGPADDLMILPVEPQRKALLLGCSHYEHHPDLPAVANDLEMMAGVISDQLIGNFQVEVSHNDSAQVVRERIDRFLSGLSIDDTALLYFSGHGSLDEGLLLLLSDADPQLPLSTSIDGEALGDMLSRSPCDRVVVILDCCYASSVDLRADLRGLHRHGRYILASSESDQLSFTRGHGTSAFTQAIIDGLIDGSADGAGGRIPDGEVTVDELFAFAANRTAALSPSNQRPRRFVVDDGLRSVVFARVPPIGHLPSLPDAPLSRSVATPQGEAPSQPTITPDPEQRAPHPLSGGPPPPRPQRMNGTAAVSDRLAPFGRRLGARSIDAAVWLLLAVLAAVPFVLRRVALGDMDPELSAIELAAGQIVQAVLIAGYEIHGSLRTGQTFGKRLLGLQVVGESGEKPALGQALRRAAPIALFGLVSAIEAALAGYVAVSMLAVTMPLAIASLLTVAFGEQKAALWDLVASTRVVDARMQDLQAPPSHRPPPPPPPRQ